MQLTTGPPLLFALGIRILINLFNPEHTPSTSDHLLLGLWQGVLLYHTLIHLSELILVVALGIAAKLIYDISTGFDATKSASTLLGIALGVLVTNVLSLVFESGGEAGSTSVSGSKERERDRRAITTNPPPQQEPSRRLRLVSFDRTRRHSTSHRPTTREREKAREPSSREHRERHDRHDRHYDPSFRDAVSPAPTLAYSIDTAPSISIDSVTSSIDPKGIMSPQEREVAILRARASLADSERRRFKEERKWALSQGNKARASQLAWQVKRYAALMESFHREADAKVVEAARVISSQPSIPFPTAGPSNPQSTFAQHRASAAQSRQRAISQTQLVQQSQASTSKQPHAERPPLVSVTVGTAPQQGVRSRKRSGGTTSTLRPAIHVRGRESSRK